MKFRYLPLILAFPILSSSCTQEVIVGRGDLKVETRQLQSSNFNRIEINAPVDARISIGAAASVSLEGYSNQLPYLHSMVENNTLRIYIDENISLHGDKHIVANITLPALTGLDISGSCDASVTGVLNSPGFELGAGGSCSVSIQELHVQSFKSNMSGSTRLVLRSGDLADGSFDMSGSGSISAFGVVQQNCTLDLSGSAEAEVNVAAKLHVKISGSGSVAYKGHPAVTQDISGSGSIKEAN